MIQNRDRWRALVNSVKIFQFHKLREISWLAEDHLASQEGLYSVKLVSLVSYLLSTFWRFIYIHLIYFHPSSQWRNSSSGPGPPHYRGFTITLRQTTFGMIPLYEWSARRRDLYLTTHNTPKRQTSMHPAEFEPTNSASQRPQTHTLDHVVTDFYSFISANKRHESKF